MTNLTRSRMKQLRGLQRKKVRRETGLFLVEGVRACEAMLQSAARAELALIAPQAENDERARRVFQALAERGAEALSCSAEELQSVADAATAQGLLAVARWTDRADDELVAAPPPLALALDRVGDPGNVGTILRAADWFGVGAVLLGEGCADVLSPKTVRSSAGSLFHVPLWRDVDLHAVLARLKERGHAVLAADAAGNPCGVGWCKGNTTLVLGNEARGLSAEVRGLADALVAVPGRGRAESLNVAMAAVALLSLAHAV